MNRPFFPGARVATMEAELRAQTRRRYAARLVFAALLLTNLLTAASLVRERRARQAAQHDFAQFLVGGR